MSHIQQKTTDESLIPTPSSWYANLFFNLDWKIKIKISTWEIFWFEQLQSDWNQVNNLALDFIKNKPTLWSMAWENTWDYYTSVSIDTLLSWKQNSLWFTPENIANKGVINGYASLWPDWKVPSSQIPDLAITEYLGNFIDTITALATPSVNTSQKWDWFTVDTSWGKTYIVLNNNPTLLTDITLIKTPTDAVLSVNWQTGNVLLDSDNILEWTNNKYLSAIEKTDLTNGWNTTLHNHDDRYYTEAEINTLISNVWVNFFTLSETVVLNGDTYQQSCISQTDARYWTAVELTWPTVTDSNIAWWKAVSDTWVINSIPAWPITTHLKVRKISWSADFTFYYQYYKLTSDWTETLLWTSSTSDQVHSNATTEFIVTTILPATTFWATDRLMRKGFFTKVWSWTDPVVWITVEWADPTYVSLAIPVTAVSFAHNDTTWKQGWTSWEYYHLTQTQHTNATQNASWSQTWLLSSTDWTTFNWKQSALWFTPANSTTTLTINWIAQDLSTNRSWTILWWGSLNYVAVTSNQSVSPSNFYWVTCTTSDITLTLTDWTTVWDTLSIKKLDNSWYFIIINWNIELDWGITIWIQYESIDLYWNWTYYLIK